MIKCFKVFNFVLLFAALAAATIAVATNYWIEHSSTQHQGIWFYCNDNEIGCKHFDQDPFIIIAGGVPGKMHWSSIAQRYILCNVPWCTVDSNSNSKRYSFTRNFSSEKNFGWIYLPLNKISFRLFPLLTTGNHAPLIYQFNHDFSKVWLTTLNNFLKFNKTC